MKQSFEYLRGEIASFEAAPELDETLYQEFVTNSTVILTAGGEGARLKSLTEAQRVNKASFLLPNGDTMIQRTIRMYRDAGFKRFVALVYHEASTIVDLLGDGSEMGISVTYSYDPEKPVGKGGAILNALLNGSISKSSNLIVHNPDDQIVGYPGSFPRDVVGGHMAGVAKDMVATAVVVDETPYPYTGMKVQKSVIEEIEMYPMIPVPAHVGVTLFSAAVYDCFERLFGLTQKADFEAVLFPLLSSEGRLYAVQIPGRCWIPVNDPRSLKQLVESIADEAIHS